MALGFQDLTNGTAAPTTPRRTDHRRGTNQEVATLLVDPVTTHRHAPFANLTTARNSITPSGRSERCCHTSETIFPKGRVSTMPARRSSSSNQTVLRRTLSLRVLRTLARLSQSDFLAFDFARVTGQESRAAQRLTQRLVVLHQRSRDAVSDRAGLTRTAATFDSHVYVEAIRRFDHLRAADARPCAPSRVRSTDRANAR